MPHDIAVPVHLGVGDAQVQQLLNQQTGQIPLLVRAGDLLLTPGRLGIDGDIAQETFLYSHVCSRSFQKMRASAFFLKEKSSEKTSISPFKPLE